MALWLNYDEKVPSPKIYTQCKSRVQKPYPIYDQKWLEKTIPFQAARNCIAHIREYPWDFYSPWMEC